MEEIKECFRLLMQLVHPDRQGENKRWPDACAAQANWAYSMLRDQETRHSFEAEADARAALQRAINRASIVAEASQAPAIKWPKKSAQDAFALPHQMLPEWMTAGIGGYGRRHPATAAFGALIALAALIVGASLLEGGDGSLVRVARKESPPPSSTAATPAATWETLTVAGPSAAEPPAATAVAAPAQRAIVLASASSTIDVARASNDNAPSAVAMRSAPGASPSSATNVPVSTAAASTSLATESKSAEIAPTTPQLVAKADTAPASQTQPAPVSVAIGAPAGGAAPSPAPVTPMPPISAEVEALFASFVDSYEHGRVDAFAALFDDDADTNLRRGRVAIRGEYDELFRLSQWRRIQLTRVTWRPVGDRAVAKGEITVKIGWRDGREIEQRVNIDMELVRRDGRIVIARLSHQPKSP
jgi:hypothetical protein